MSTDNKNDSCRFPDHPWNISDALVALMSKKNVDAMELSHQTGVPVPTINRLRSNKFSNPTISTLVPIASYFGVSINQLIGRENISFSFVQDNYFVANMESVPLITIEQVKSFLSDYCDDKFTYIGKGYFALMSKNAWLLPEFSENTVLIFDSNLKCKHGDYALVLLDGHKRPSLRKILIDGDDVYFGPLLNMAGEILLGAYHQIIARMVQAITNYR